MNSAIERLLGLRVSDIMNRDVITISANTTMSDGADILARHEISGAPVVDEMGRVVGVLSASDYAARERQLAASGSEGGLGLEHELIEERPGSPIFIEAVAEDLVSRHMSQAVQTIASKASLTNAARVMCREHIHRLIIIDEDERPVGIISSLDLIAAMVAAIEE